MAIRLKVPNVLNVRQTNYAEQKGYTKRGTAG